MCSQSICRGIYLDLDGGDPGFHGRAELLEKLFDGVRKQPTDADLREVWKVGRGERRDVIWEDGLVVPVVGDGEGLEQWGELKKLQQGPDGWTTVGGNDQMFQGGKDWERCIIEMGVRM